MVQFADRMDLLKGSAIRELLALANKPEIISFAGGMVFLALISLRGRRRVREEARPAAGAGAAGSGIWQFIRENKRFSLFLLGAALLFATHSLLNNFVIVVVRNVGGDSGDMAEPSAELMMK